MAIIQKYDVAATTKTHGLVDGSLLDVFLPSKPLDATGELIRMAAFGAMGWVGRGYKESRTFGF